MRTRPLLPYDMDMKKTVKNDILLILVALLAAGMLWGALRLTATQGADAVVTVDGKVEAVLPLTRDGTFSVDGSRFGDADGSCANLIMVENGRVCVSEADCPDQICVRHGWIRYAGESIVCLPHRLVVTVRGGTKGPDAYSG